MDSPDSLATYGLVKLAAYVGWCWVALRLAGLRAQMKRAFGMGLVRWLLGLLLGVLIFIAVRAPREDVLMLYIAVYVPVRALEWGLLAALVLPRGERWPRRRLAAWVAGGIVLSFLTDLTSPQMLEHGHFCVGRCLC
jgi:hypothetical protein